MKLFGELDIWIGLVLGNLGILLWLLMLLNHKVMDVITLLAFDLLIGTFFLTLIWVFLGVHFVINLFSNLSVIGIVLCLSGVQSYMFMRKPALFSKFLAPPDKDSDNL